MGDVIVVLEGEELARRIGAVKANQRHVRRRRREEACGNQVKGPLLVNAVRPKPGPLNPPSSALPLIRTVLSPTKSSMYPSAPPTATVAATKAEAQAVMSATTSSPLQASVFSIGCAIQPPSAGCCPDDLSDGVMKELDESVDWDCPDLCEIFDPADYEGNHQEVKSPDTLKSFVYRVDTPTAAVESQADIEEAKIGPPAAEQCESVAASEVDVINTILMSDPEAGMQTVIARATLILGSRYQDPGAQSRLFDLGFAAANLEGRMARHYMAVIRASLTVDPTGTSVATAVATDLLRRKDRN